MKKLSPKTAWMFTILAVALCMVGIVVIWLLVSPPRYFQGDSVEGDVFDTIKGEFSEVF